MSPYLLTITSSLSTVRVKPPLGASPLRFQSFYPLMCPPVQAPAKVRLARSVVTTHAAITARSRSIVLRLEVSFHRRVDSARRGKRGARVLRIHATIIHQR